MTDKKSVILKVAQALEKALRALQDTTLLFWKDSSPLSFSQALCLWPVQGAMYALARRTYTGADIFISYDTLGVVFLWIIGSVFLFTGDRMGRLEEFGPKLIRTVSLHLIGVLGILATNNFLIWHEYFHPWLVAIVANSLVTILFLPYTARKHGNVRSVWKGKDIYIGIFIVFIINVFFTRYVVLPAR